MHVTRAGLTFDVRDDGPRDGEPVVLLHGFPQTSVVWTALIARLHAAGYRTLAPDQRGYSPGARPRGVRVYALPELVADALAVLDAATAGRAHLVAHDWGAGVAWALAARHPDRVASLTSLSSPPPQALLRGLLRPRQAFAAWYIAVIAIPGLVEWVHARRPDVLVRLLERSGQSRAAAERDIGVDRSTLTAMLNWYRAMPFGGRDPGLTRAPVLYVWGSADTALLRSTVERTARWVPGPLTYVELPGASHWLPEQNVDEVAPVLLRHLAAHPARDG
jgi:pimeloyl-ACP methyl ester carboxylesterase